MFTLNTLLQMTSQTWNKKARHKQHAQQCTLEKGSQTIGKSGKEAVLKEMGQLNNGACFKPMQVEDMTPEENSQAQIALTHLTEKQDKSIKGRTVCDGKPTKEWSSHEESASPTALMEGTFLTTLMDAWEKHDSMTADTPNKFAQAKLNKKHG